VKTDAREHNYYINTSAKHRVVNQTRKKKTEKSQPGGHDPNRVTRTSGKHDAHGVTKVVLFVGTRRGSDNGTCGSDTGSLCRSRSNDAGTAELRAESDDVDERIGDALFRTSGRGGSGEDVWLSPCDCRGGWDRGDG